MTETYETAKARSYGDILRLELEICYYKRQRCFHKDDENAINKIIHQKEKIINLKRYIYNRTFKEI